MNATVLNIAMGRICYTPPDETHATKYSGQVVSTPEDNSTDDYSYYDELDGLESLHYTGLLAFACITNIVGNICTILAFTRDKKLKSVQANYILNLAVTDLSQGVVTLPLMTVWYGVYDDWPFSAGVCKFLWVVDFLMSAESAYTVVLISYDRFLLVQDGIQYNQTQTRKRVLIKISVSWLVAFCLYTPAIIGYDHWRGYSTMYDGDCDVEFAEEPIYNVIMAFFEFTISFILICSFNLMTFWKIRERATRGHEKEGPVAGIKDGGQRSKGARKAARSLALVVVVFMVCWLPYSIVNLINAFCTECITLAVVEVVDWVLWMNCSLNPIIYVLTNNIFRQSIKDVLCPCIKSSKVGQTGSSSVNKVSIITTGKQTVVHTAHA